MLPPVADKIEETDEETEPKDTTIRGISCHICTENINIRHLQIKNMK